MKIIYPENIVKYLKDKIVRNYFLFGDDIFLIQYSIRSILRNSKFPKDSLKIKSFHLDSDTELCRIEEHLILPDLFCMEKIVIINVSDEKLFLRLIEDGRMDRLLSSWNQTSIFIFITLLKKINENQKVYFKLKNFIDLRGISIDCDKPDKSRFFKFIEYQMKIRSINLEQTAFEMMLENVKDLKSTEEIFDRLSRVFLDKTITISQIRAFLENEVNQNNPRGNIIYELLLGNIRQSWKWIQNLKKKEKDIFKLVRSIQNELILLFLLLESKKVKGIRCSILKMFNLKFWKHYENFIKDVDRHFILSLMEITVRTEYLLEKSSQDMVWLEIEKIIILFANRKFINDVCKK
ncbi:DNA polymerase III subunit delta [Candidatus Riesia pediculischaeffi]|uniref:DNA polymerase III subunit delta n=1 Tax=Candidatus Riesia pediculischaeffi PTSU TaxID=1401651 RepID=A0A0C1S0B9_9ENTR|nr:hypothetical protein [Candidatus Riesia pediculischaeffi]KIE64002.1 DNA polymerase III delta subunit [Candidatus Riesia pediculischaeffi PTSU]